MLIVTCSTILAAQQVANDVIITNDARRIEAKISQVSSSDIQYREAGFEDGPLFILKTDEISSITFSNGQVRVYQHQPIKENTKFKGFQTGSITFRTYIDAAAILGRGTLEERIDVWMENVTVAGPTFNVELGAFFHDIIFAGAGFGFHGSYSNWMTRGQIIYTTSSIGKEASDYHFPTVATAWYTPIYANVKVYFLKKQFSPFADMSLGGYVGVTSKVTIDRTTFDLGKNTTMSTPNGGFYYRIGLGADFKHFIFGIGYECMKDAKNKGIDHLGYVKLGVRIGK